VSAGATKAETRWAYTHEVLVERRQVLLETLALARVADDIVDPVTSCKRVAVHGLPVVEGALREGLAASRGAEGANKAE
jgi:hypothetical protein